MQREIGFRLPPRTHRADGAERRVGLEIELAGLDVRRAAEIVRAQYGGTIEDDHRFKTHVRGTELGDFRVEIDTVILTERKYIELLESAGVDIEHSSVTDTVETLLSKVTAPFVPCEIITPPVQVSALDRLEPLRRALAEAGARGTTASWHYAFGLHLNPELPDTSMELLLAHLRAFLLLYEWIAGDSKIDFTRLVTPYIEAFPERYRLHVVDPSYQPDLAGLITDYLLWNPSRNRPLDLLPIFTALEPSVVKSSIGEDELTKPRLAFHYRLPNCKIDDPSWSFAEEWNRWVEVERLAADPARLDLMSRDYLEMSTGPMRLRSDEWLEELEIRGRLAFDR